MVSYLLVNVLQLILQNYAYMKIQIYYKFYRHKEYVADNLQIIIKQTIFFMLESNWLSEKAALIFAALLYI